MAFNQFTNLDFADLRAQIKDYLRTNSNFTDFDFEGSNFSVLIDLLAYNSYITAYNTNMAVNECFLDSATLRENVVSLARNIGYVPRSSRSASATVNFSVDLGTNDTRIVILKAGQVALGNQQGGQYIFSIPDDFVATVDDNNVTSTLLAWNRTSTTGGSQTRFENGDNFIIYQFVSVYGHSKFGHYEGNGNANGTFVYTGFSPALVMVKSIDSTSDWEMYDNVRAGYNVDNNQLEVNDEAAQDTGTFIDLLSNGFKLRASGDPNVAETYIYGAWAHNSLKYATAV